METYIFYSDPGHSWLRVKKEEIKSIKDEISSYSYMNGKYVYLEEDCDAAIFLIHKFGSFENAKGHTKDKYAENTIIKSYRHYDPNLI